VAIAKHRGSVGIVLGSLAALTIAACSAAPALSPTPSPAGAPSAPTATMSAAPASEAPGLTPQPTISGPHLTVVGLGDSVPGGLKCNPPCRSYVITYGELAAAALGEAVATTKLATNDGLESDTLLGRVQRDDGYRNAIAGADILTLQVGWNDWQGPCDFSSRGTCLVFGQKRVEPNLDAILTEITALRAGKPTAIRVVTYYDGYRGNKLTGSIWGFEASAENIATFEADFRSALRDFDAMICRVAVAHHAVCVDVAPAFNGPKFDRPAAAGLINSDGIHGLAAGQDLIAHTIAAAGFSELK
jgi:hypothetical protein